VSTARVSHSQLEARKAPNIGYLLALLALGCASYPAFSQSASLERNATEQEIQGNWRLIPLPDALLPKGSGNPWPAACQWYSYLPTGVLKSIDKTLVPCDTLTSTQLNEIMNHVQAVVSWKYDLSPVYNKALLIVTRSDVKGYAEYWEPHYVHTPFSKAGAEFKRGDLLLYLVNLQSKKIMWIRHLERVQ